MRVIYDTDIDILQTHNCLVMCGVNGIEPDYSVDSISICHLITGDKASGKGFEPDSSEGRRVNK